MPLPLPEKFYYRLDEIATRWGCTVDDVLHYGAIGKLNIAGLADGWRARYDPLEDQINGIPLQAWGGNISGLVGIFSHDLIGVFKKGRAQIRHLRNDVFVGGPYRITLTPEVEITAQDLVVCPAARDKFEADHGIATANGAADAEQLGRKEESYLRTIGGLCLLLMHEHDPGCRYGMANDPNIDPLIKDIQDALNRPKRAYDGQSSETLKDRLRDAIQIAVDTRLSNSPPEDRGPG